MSGAFPHQHGDPRTLTERIEAQLRERIQEAAEVAALELMVERRRRRGLPVPENDNHADRREFDATTRELLTQVRAAFRNEMPDEQRAELEQAESGPAELQRLLAGHALLARRVPDYWQRFERYRADYARTTADAPTPRTGLLARLFGS